MGLNEIAYVNPASFKPQLSDVDFGPMGGLKYYNDNANYDQFMQDTHALQALGLQNATQQQAEFMRGVPLRNQVQDNQLVSAQAQNPYLARLAQNDAETKLAEGAFKRDTEFSQASVRNYLETLKKQGKDREYADAVRKLQLSHQAAQTALSISEKDPKGAMDYMKQQFAEAQRMGVELPKVLEDPRNWASMVKSGVASLPHLQKLEEIHATGDEHARYAEILGKYGLGKAEIAATRASGNGNVGDTQDYPTAVKEIQGKLNRGEQVTSADIARLDSAIEADFPAYVQKLHPFLSLELANPDPAEKKKAFEALARIKGDFIAERRKILNGRQVPNNAGAAVGGAMPTAQDRQNQLRNMLK